jgi:beta-glucanase (GH16 family)
LKRTAIRLIGLAVPALLSISGEAQSPVNSDAATPPSGYTLVWSDEFSQDPDGLPDPNKWSYEVGFIRNQESQYYTQARLENARIEKGQLIIEARKEEYTPPGAAAPVARYTSAALETIGKAEWQYGRIEVRAKLPAGKGVWPAIWTLGSSIKKGVGWPRCGEIDLMELVGKQPDIIYGTIHYFADGKHASKGGQVHVDHSDAGFHIYAAEWTPSRIDLSVDGQEYFSFNTDLAANGGRNPFHEPQYLILNLALGGGWGGPIDDSIFPQRMTVDYVRVYQKQVASP